MDRRVEKTKESIKNAFLDLLVEKQNERLTISEIAKKANIGRKTFYLHYSCIEDIVNDIEFSLENDLYQRALTFFQMNTKSEIGEVFFDLNEIIQKNLPILTKASNSNYYFMFKGLCIDVIRPTVELILKEKYHLYGEELSFYGEFYSSGVGSLYASYMQKKSNLTLDQIAEICIKTCFKGLDNIKTN